MPRQAFTPRGCAPARAVLHKCFLVHAFRSVVLIDDFEAGHGMGESKKEAEQAAAHSVALEMDDEVCARLLDKLDRLESNQR